MKVKIFFLACIIQFLFSCNNKDTDTSFCKYFKEMEVSPDSAFSLLDSLSKTKIDNIALELLKIKAKDLQDQDIRDDFSVVSSIANYLKETNAMNMSRFAYYYQGRIKAEQSDSPEALKFFRKALTVDSRNNFLKNKIYSQMGELYYYQSLYNEAADMYRKAYHIAKEDRDKDKMAMALRDLAHVNLDLKNYNQALALLKQATILAEGTTDTRLMGSIYSYFTSAYIHIKNYKVAHIYLEKSLTDINKADSIASYAIASDYYTNVNTDSAFYFYNILKDKGTIYARSKAYYFFTEYYLKRHQEKESVAYLKKYQASIDTINLRVNSEMLAKAKGLYDYRLHEEEANLAKEKNEKLQSLMVSCFMATIIILLLIYVYLLKVKHKNQEALKRIMQLKKIQNDILQRTDEQISSNEKRIKELEVLLEDTKKEKTELYNSLEEEYKRLKSVNAIQKIEKVKINLLSDSFKSSAIYKRIEEIELMENKVHLNKEEKQLLINTFGTLAPSFKQDLVCLCELNPRELLVCMLIKLGKKPALISTLLDCTPSAISQIRKRLYQKVFNKKGAAEDWDAFILSI